MTVKNTISASVAVITRWLVTVKKPGIRPKRFSTRMKLNSANTSGKKRMPSSPAPWRSMSATKS